MLDFAITWLLGHPLEGVAVLAGISIAAGVFLVPRVHEISTHGHPRC
jgi:hypothetical protein